MPPHSVRPQAAGASALNLVGPAPAPASPFVFPKRHEQAQAAIAGEHPTLRLERRRDTREEADEAAASTPVLTATFSGGAGLRPQEGNEDDADGASARFGIASVQVVDQSRIGLGIRTTTKIEPGMTVTIRRAGSRLPLVTATAVRCVEERGAAEPGSNPMYRVGLAISPRTAA